MSRNRATQRAHSQIDGDIKLLDYFFETKLGPKGELIYIAKRDLVHRDEMYAVLSWHTNKVLKPNRWYKVLWRALKGAPMAVLNPFTWIRMKNNGTDPAEGVLDRPSAPATKKYDAEGKLIDA